MKSYTEKQQSEFVELAQTLGIGPARRELGYPSYPTAIKWCQQRGVTPNVDTLMQSIKQYHTFYQDRDALLVCEQALARVQEKLTSDHLDADELKKVSEALQKTVNTWLLLQGKANNITEKVSKDTTDIELLDLLNTERAKNSVSPRDLRTTDSEA